MSFNKIKWTLGILLIFLLILATNLIDRNNFIRIRDSIVTIYEDRLVAKELVYDMSQLIRAKELALLTSDSEFYSGRNKTINKEIADLSERFSNTKLTAEEAITYQTLEANIEKLLAYEKEILPAQEAPSDPKMRALIASVDKNLNELAKIQVEEGRRQFSIGKKAINSMELFTQLEIYFLIFLAIIIQIIVLYQPKEKD